ncbi:MAG: peptide-methionine (S)-S-oxide reductase MsrA [Candidatus Gastranaerophilales bacterium]|nr:peptide-methionine (S)-S-oxide reductase MsrA [Candidatus Gastranaerophilales bacterium]
MLFGSIFDDIKSEEKIIYLGGGCFWGIEAYFSKIQGIKDTKVGYANGNIKNPTYLDVITGTTGFVEVVKLSYDPKIHPLADILDHFFDIIDPTSFNKQGNDVGSQYRSGVYYIDLADRKIIEDKIKEIQPNYPSKIMTEVEKLRNFYSAEEYHQKYLQKNKTGYCHVNLDEINKYFKPSMATIKANLDDESYKITQKKFTEKPFSSPFLKNNSDGIYVDIVSGEPLFSSKDKYESGSGWPSFTKPINKKFIKELPDNTYKLHRTEVKSSFGDSHLGHLFDDGPTKTGGKRYCINGKALKFIPIELMQEKGYSKYLKIFQPNL